jgi:hypothetical protein
MNKAYRLPWAQLGWMPAPSFAAPGHEAGRVAFAMIAPWCPDCRELGPRLRAQAPKGVPVWLVGEFAPREEILAFAAEFGLDWPVLIGQGAKTEQARIEARFRDIRQSFGDGRKWGLPLWIEGRIEHGWLVAARLRWPG